MTCKRNQGKGTEKERCQRDQQRDPYDPEAHELESLFPPRRLPGYYDCPGFTKRFMEECERRNAEGWEWQ
eukprot:2551639-Amphidinium_carterae.2